MVSAAARHVGLVWSLLLLAGCRTPPRAVPANETVATPTVAPRVAEPPAPSTTPADGSDASVVVAEDTPSASTDAAATSPTVTSTCTTDDACSALRPRHGAQARCVAARDGHRECQLRHADGVAYCDEDIRCPPSELGDPRIAMRALCEAHRCRYRGDVRRPLPLQP